MDDEKAWRAKLSSFGEIELGRASMGKAQRGVDYSQKPASVDNPLARQACGPGCEKKVDGIDTWFDVVVWKNHS